MPIELKELIIKILKESKNSLSPVDIYNYIIIKGFIHHTIRNTIEIQHIRKICNELVNDGILIEKVSEKYAYDLKNETLENKIELASETPIPEQTLLHLRKKIINILKETRFFDLKLGILLIIFSIFFILIPPLNQTFIRIIIALPFLLFLPGYLLTCIMFPKRGELSPIERITLSIGLSIAIVVFDSFALNYSQWGFRPNSIVMSLSLIMGVILIATYLKRKKFGANAYEFSFTDIEYFYLTLKSRSIESGHEYNPGLEKTIIWTMVFLIILGVVSVIYDYNSTKEPENFTAFYILGSTAKIENYPTEVYINRPAQLLVGIENFEDQPVNYTLRVQLGGKILKEQLIYLKNKDKWLENVTFTPRMTQLILLAGIDNRSKLEFLLLKDNISFRSVHLWIRPIFNINDFDNSVILTNSDMEKNIGWNFTSSNENITGSYTNSSWISPLHSYEINFNASDSNEYGEIYQNVTVDKESISTLTFYVNDSYSNVTANISKQVLQDGKVIWEEGVVNKSWEEIHLPVFFSNTSRLEFRVYNKLPINDTYQVLWDDIKIEPFIIWIKSISNEYITIPALLNNNQQMEFKIPGKPFVMKGNQIIDGSNFPGFYYDIDENISYEKLDLSFSDDSTLEAGDAIYISTLHGDEISFLGQRYKLVNKTDIGLLSKALIKNVSKTLNISEIWNLDNDYSMVLRVIDSKGDSALLELWKGRKLLDSRLLKVGRIFEYKASVAKNTTIIFTTKIDSMNSNFVKVKETWLYSDIPLKLEVGKSIEDFEIMKISSTDILMKNSYPLKIKDGVFILDRNIRFKVMNDTAIPYSAAGDFRGATQKIRPGSTMIINGLNYPGFFYDFDNNTPLEELRLNISFNNTIDVGNAVYQAYRKGNELYFLGNSYLLPKDRINFITGSSSTKKTIPKNGSVSLGNGYNLSLSAGPDNSIKIFLKKETSQQEKNLLDILTKTNSKGILTEYIYEMYTTTFKKGRLKSNIIYEAGEEFEYWTEYRKDEMYLLVSGEITAMDSQNVTLDIRMYQMPVELLPGMSFGNFEIDQIGHDTISLKNTKSIILEPGKEVSLMGDVLKMRISSKEPILYPIKGK